MDGEGRAGEHRIEVAARPEAALAAVERAAEQWGAGFERDGISGGEGGGGRLLLPVAAGMRRGAVAGPLTVEPTAGGSRLVFRVEQTDYHVHTPAVAVLLFALAGGLVATLWPLIPSLLPAAPLGAVLALGAWFLVISRLQTNGPGDFLETVAAVVGEAGESREHHIQSS